MLDFGFEKLFEIYADKDKSLYKEAFEKQSKMLEGMNPWLCVNIVDCLVDVLQNSERSQKEYVYRLLYQLIKLRPIQIAHKMSELIPLITNDSNSSIKEVKTYAMKCLKAILKCSGNEDLNPIYSCGVICSY